MLADDHALVDFHAGADEEDAAFLQAVERVGGGGALAVGNQRAGGPLRNLSLIGNVAVEERVHHDGAARFGQHFAAQADDAAAGHAEFHAHATGAVIVHLGHLALARSKLLNHHAGMLFGHVDGQVLHRLHTHAVHHAGHNLRAACHQLETFAAHHLNQNGKLQFAAAQHLEAVWRVGFFHADGDVGEQFLLQALAQVAAGDVLAFAASKGAVVHAELDGDGGLIDDDERQRIGVFKRGNGFADGDAFHACHGHNVAHGGLCGFSALEAREGEQLGDFGFLQRAVAFGDGDLVAGVQCALEDAADGDAAEVLRVVKIGHQNLQRGIGVAGRGRNGVHDGLK